MKYAFLLLAAFLLLTITACASDANADPSPPPIHFGEDVCEFCGMIISEQGYAAGYVTADGHGHSFDDIGDMIQAQLKNPEDVSAYFANDFAGEGWIRAETAYFVYSPDLPTPMLSGIVAFASLEAAEAFAAENQGEVFSLDELFTRYKENPPTPIFGNTGQ